MNSKEILNELRKTMDEIKQKPLSKPEVYMMSWNEKYQLDNKLLCFQEENTKLEKENEALKLSRESIKNNYVQLVDKLVKENSKLKKVIEILINKEVVINWIMTDSLEMYNAGLFKEYQLTQEEYDLLRRHFKNE